MNYELRKQKDKSRKCFPRFFHNSYFLIPNSPKKGFSLIELMVSIAIFTLLTSIVMVSQQKFGGQILITNLAYDIALGIREAQVYGISVKTTTGGKFDKSYGIHFKDPNYYVLFVDSSPANGKYDGPDSGSACMAGGECLSFFRIEKGNAITRLCADNECTDSGAGNQISGLDLLFTRPEPDPMIHPLDNAGAQMLGAFSTAQVTVASPQGLTRTINILKSGQVSVVN
ncbi:MAG: prepilin-type N-terminal cleavage/methylation domain-containing protein [Patescibacteria group bacterium]